MRVVVFTQGGITPSLALFLSRLETEPGVELAAVVVDDRRGSAWRRARLLSAKWGLRVFAVSIGYQVLRVALSRVVSVLFRLWHDRFVPPRPSGSVFRLSEGVRIEHVADINSRDGAALIRSLDADLGVIVGGRVLKDRVTGAPRLGTLNIHKHDARKYRGGAQVGYPECVNGDDNLVVTIHYATSRVDAGNIVATRAIPIERFDSDRSLAIKAEVQGMALYLEAVRRVRDGTADAEPQEGARAEYQYTTPYLQRDRFWRKRRRRHRRALRDPYYSAPRAIVRGVRNGLVHPLLPMLAARRRALERAGRAPIVIFYYHGVGNGAENWMHLPLEAFDEQVQYINTYFRILSLDEAVQRLRAGKSSETAAVLTFDDGYASLHSVLLPYLRYYGIPATFFVCADAARTGARLEHDTGKGIRGAALMTPDEIAECAREGVTIGSHGNFHEDMARLDGDALRTALLDSGQAIAAWTGEDVRYFSFPFGGLDNLSEEAMSVASGRYDSVFSAYGGYNLPGGANRFHFTRFANPTNRAGVVAVMNGLHRFKPYYSLRPGYLDR